jgi:hypothetical protein
MEPLKEGRVMHTRTKKKVKRPQHVLLYPLPEAESDVKKLAFSAGCMDEVLAMRKGGSAGDATAVQVAALNQCARFQSHHFEGKSGTNDPRGFKELFIPTYIHGRESLARLLKTADSVLLARLPRDLTELATYFHTYASAHPEIVEASFVGYAFDLDPLP